MFFVMGMNLPDKLNSLFRAPPLTRARMFLALAIAVAADGLQLLLAEFGWFGLDQAIDCAAMVLLSWTIGFHVLFLQQYVVFGDV